MNELDETSEKNEQIYDINITLKDHQLSMIKRCIDIENINICGLGIMNDKPGCGKTYAILGLIYITKKKNNIIVIPQNILGQWCDSIHSFSNGLLTYKKFIEYNDILDLYNKDTTLFEYDILLTTSLYYNVIATSCSYKVNRVFFDEIDSISNFVMNEINANFIWFVSASFRYSELGIYTTKIDEELIPYIICKCKDEYIKKGFILPEPKINKIICKNIYMDNIFSGLFNKEEYKVLNAMDYSRLKNKFSSKIAQNETEALDIIVKDKLEIIETEELRMNDIVKALETTDDEIRTKSLHEQFYISKKSLEESKYKLNLIKERLKEYNCCPLCYNEFEQFEKKVLSPCCKNIICNKCTNNWFQKMKKTNCIYCNKQDIKYEDYVLIKNECYENKCILCDKEYETMDDRYYSNCCNKKTCKNCLNEWYNKLLKKKCLFCYQDDISIEDFKNEKEYEDMKINIQNGIIYTKKTKLEFIEYFIKTKIYSNKSKIIICSDYIGIFNNIKKLFISYHIQYLELDNGNVEDIYHSIKKYSYGYINVLLLNSNLFGCGLNLECTTDILFLHKTNDILEKQIIGRAQRPGRKDSLNIWYIMYENEKIINTLKKSYDHPFGLNFSNNNQELNIINNQITNEITGYNLFDYEEIIL